MYSPKITAQTRAKLESRLGEPLREYTYGEVAEFAARLRGVDWTPGTAAVLPTLPEDIQRYVVNELRMCPIDFRYWVTRYCCVLTDEKKLEPLTTLWPSQERLLKILAQEEEKQLLREGFAKVRVILLKARQVGGTAISEALCAHMTFLQRMTQSIVGSDHPDNTFKLWQTLLRMHENLPGWMRPIADSRPKAQNLHLPELDSDIVYGSGNQRTTLGQGLTVDFVHITETSTWLYPRYLDEDLMPAFDSSRKHHSLCVLESTAAGGPGNWYHDLWQAANKGEGEFAPLFVGWYDRPTRRINAEGIELDAESQNLAKMVKETVGIDLSREQLAWWQRKRRSAELENKLGTFLQEHPSVAQEAFQTRFPSVFGLEQRRKLRREAQPLWKVFKWDHKGKAFRDQPKDQWLQSGDSRWADHLVVWEARKPGNIYVVGVDASHGVDGGDYAAIEVLRVGNRSRPDEQVAEWWGNINAVDLASVVWKIGHLFNEWPYGLPALVSVEVNYGSPGIVTQTELMKRGYPNFFRWRRPLRADGRWSAETGWWTTAQTRPLLTERGVRSIGTGDLLINSGGLVDEMDTFVNTGIERGIKHLEHAPGYHDDRIMALFIAYATAHWNDLVDLAEERRRSADLRTTKPSESRQFWQILKDPKELAEEWEERVSQTFFGS